MNAVINAFSLISMNLIYLLCMPDGSPCVACCILHALLRHCILSAFELKASGEFGKCRKAEIDAIRKLVSSKTKLNTQAFLIARSIHWLLFNI